MDFSYILENYINCLIEAVALMLFFGVLNDRRRRWPHYLAAFFAAERSFFDRDHGRSDEFGDHADEFCADHRLVPA